MKKTSAANPEMLRKKKQILRRDLRKKMKKRRMFESLKKMVK